MATLPASVDFTDASTTEAEFKTAIGQQRDFLAGLLGTDGTPATARTALGVSTGTVTSVSGTAPVSVATGTTTPVISMAAATASVNGYMTSTYASKLNGIEAGANVGLDTDAGVGGVGLVALMMNVSGASVASGATVAGTSLRYAYWNGSAIAGGNAATGTWRNVTTLAAGDSTAHTFQRIS